MVTGCPESIKRLYGICVNAEEVILEPFSMNVMTAIHSSLFHAVAETGIVLPAISTRQRNGYINKWRAFYLHTIFY
jgi:hypothetical protein